MTDLSQVEILLVEDNPNDLELTLIALKKHNFANNLHVVRDGEEALNYINKLVEENKMDIKKYPRLILLDLKLPKIDGLEVLKQLKSGEKTKFIPIVVLTSSNEESDVVRSYNYGVNSYLVKPVDFDKFVKAVSEIGLYWLLLNRPVMIQ